MLTNPADRAFIVKVLLSIDAATVPGPVAPETLILSFTSPSWNSHVPRCELRGTRIETLAGTRM